MIGWVWCWSYEGDHVYYCLSAKDRDAAVAEAFREVWKSRRWPAVILVCEMSLAEGPVKLRNEETVRIGGA